MATTRNWHDLYPFQSHEIILDGRRYHYIDEGAGPVLLMVHGNPTWSFYWRKLILAFRDRYRVIAVDHIGCGLSDKPAADEYSYRLSQRIADLGQLIERLDLRQITLVAHDWGGGIGMGAAVASPDRFARFVLMNTAAFRADRCPWPIGLCHIPLFGQLVIQGLNLFARAATRVTVTKHDRMTPEVKAGFLAPYDSWAHRVAVYRFVLDIPLTPRHPSYQTLLATEEGLAKFHSHPVCLIWGMRDWCFGPWFLERFRQFLPQAEAHPLEDAGHYVVEDADERIVPLMEAFFEKNPLDSTPLGRGG
jgi:cis-3-alkyl-4-acyloxetan-2-one decarboxylase